MYGPVFVLSIAAICLATVISLLIFFLHRTKLEYQRTVRAAIEKGQQLSPEFLESLGHSMQSRGRNRDLRIGVTSIALGASIASFGWLLGQPEAGRVFLAIGNIPFLVGVALVGLWKFAPREGG